MLRVFLPRGHSPLRPDWLAGQRGLELRNVVAKYPFERFAQISRDPAEFWPWRLFAFELRSRQGCLCGRWSLAEVAGRAAISCRSRDDPAAANCATPAGSRSMSQDNRWTRRSCAAASAAASCLLAVTSLHAPTTSIGLPAPSRAAGNSCCAGHPLRDPNWLLGGGFCRSRCWLGYHYRIGNRLRNIDRFRAGLMGTNHARPP